MWIRIAAGILRDPSIIHLSEAVRVSVPTTTGHVVGVLTSLPEGSPTGDLSAISDITIEQWAQWRGKRGAFAQAFRTYLCDAQGVVRSWEKHNGAALRELDADRKRKKAWREARKQVRQTSGGRPADVRVASAVDETIRDVTKETTGTTTTKTKGAAGRKTPPAARPDDPGDGPVRPPASKPKLTPPEPLFPHFGAAERGRCITAFRKLGAFDPGRIVRAVGPFFRAPDDPAYLPPDRVAFAVEDYCGLAPKGRSAPFAGPEDCAKRLGALARNCVSFAHDPIGRVDAQLMAIHGSTSLPGAA